MVRGKADGARVLVQIAQPQRAGVANQHAQDASSAGEISDGRLRLGVDAGGEKAFELGASGVDHPQRRIASSRQLGRSIDELL